MLAEKLRKGSFKHVESELFAYHDTRKEMIRLRNDILYSSNTGNDENVGGGRSNLPGDPTGRKVTALTSTVKLQHLEGVINAIEAVYNRLPENKKKLVNLYYWTRPQILNWEGIAQKLHVSRRQAIYWRNEIVADIGEMMGWR